MERFLYWCPRVPGIVLTGFIALFALDVFGQFSIISLLIHLIPTAIALGLLFIAWHREALGGVLCLLVGVFYIGMALHRFPLLTHGVVVGPVWRVGGLFLGHHFMRRRTT